MPIVYSYGTTCAAGLVRQIVAALLLQPKEIGIFLIIIGLLARGLWGHALAVLAACLTEAL